jgi:hypothetical protein
LRQPVESAQYTSGDYTQTLTDHVVLGSIGTVGDAYDNALAESFVDSYKTELIADRVWRSQAQLELATGDWVAWFNHDRLHGSLGDIPPVEFEQLAAVNALTRVDGSVATISPQPADGPRKRRLLAAGVDFAAQPSDLSVTACRLPNGFAQAAPTAVNSPKATDGLSELRC